MNGIWASLIEKVSMFIMEMEKCQFKQIFVPDVLLDPMKVRIMKNSIQFKGAQMSIFYYIGDKPFLENVYI
jgi:hypothetical protein